MTNVLNRILFVEDDEAIAEVAIMTLERIGGFEVRHCPSGVVALKEYTDFAPHLVLMDVMMPEMDGPETMQRLRELHGARLAPVIFMTARAQTHEQAAYIAKGAIGVIVKPFDPIELCDEIQGLWKTRLAT